MAVVLDVIVDGGSDDEATVGGCSEDFVSTSDCCLDGSSDDDGISSAAAAVVLSLVFQLGLTMLLRKQYTLFSIATSLVNVSSYLVYDVVLLCSTFVVVLNFQRMF